MATAAKKKRTKKEKSEFNKQIAKHHKLTSRHVLVLEADMKDEEKRHVIHLAEKLRQAGNQVVRTMNKRLEQMERTKEYKDTKAAYGIVLDKLKKIEDQTSERFKELTKEKQILGKKLQEIQARFEVTEYDVKEAMRKVGTFMGIPSVFSLSRADDIWAGIATILYRGGKHLNTKRYQDYPEIRAKQSNKAIPVKVANDQLRLSLDVTKNKNSINSNSDNKKKNKRNVIEFGVKVKKDDLFAQMEVDSIVSFLSTPDAEKLFVQKFIDTEISQETFRVCYAALNYKIIRGKIRVYVHLTIEGKPMPKLTKTAICAIRQAKTGLA